MVIPFSAWAADIYKFKDENGRWVYTDQKPRHSNFTQQKMLVTELTLKVSVVNRGSSEKPVLYAVNNLAGPAQVWLDLRRQLNVKLHPSTASEWLLEQKGDTFLTYISPVQQNRPWAYEWLPRYVEGKPINPNKIVSEHVPSPFKGGPFMISQSFMGTASHSQHLSSNYAVDIQMPEGTPIVAVRDGIVMDLEVDFSRSGWREEVADEANYVRLIHPDGSMTIYAHLQPDSFQVRLGQPVKAGDVLANSGNTGFSSGPHLHFAIQYNGDKKLKSWPFNFRGFNRHPEVGDQLWDDFKQIK